MRDYEGKTFLNTLIGAAVTLVLFLVPVVQGLAPALGGAVGGYLQKRGLVGGMKVGAGVTFVFMIPAAVLIVVFSGFIAAVVPMVGAGMLTGTVLFVVLFVVFFGSLVLSLVGGAVGGAVVGSGAGDGDTDTDAETDISVDRGN
jgi:hypothetical protein